jgi:hypothetical protein
MLTYPDHALLSSSRCMETRVALLHLGQTNMTFDNDTGPSNRTFPGAIVLTLGLNLALVLGADI